MIDSKGYKKMEGEFYDEFPCGKFINFQQRGKIESKGQYKLASPRKRQYCCKQRKPKKLIYKQYISLVTGQWIFYNYTGDILEKKEYKNEKG